MKPKGVLSLDDSLLSHYGQRFEQIAKLYDPVSESDKTWIIVQPEDPQKGGVVDVKSGAPGKMKDGREFSQL